MIRDVQLSDAEIIVQIYNYYITETIITFENEPIDVHEMANRIESVTRKNYPFIVYEDNGTVEGYAYLSNWRSRPAYDITLETSIYLSHDFIHRGIGCTLYKELIERSRNTGIHSLIGVISLPNLPSRKLHEKLGFNLIGNFKESGLKFGKLIDVEFWQLMLD